MSVEDPFFVVRGEVDKAVKNCEDLERQWRNILEGKIGTEHDDYDRISNELRNSIRSIEWDLEDLDETINIVEANPQKFHIPGDELINRKLFISNTRQNVNEWKSELNDPANKAKADKILRKSLLSNGLKKPDSLLTTPYSNARIEHENDNNSFLDDQNQQQQLIIDQQDEQLDLVADSVGILKNMSKSIGNELDGQAVLLDDMGTEMENTQNKMDSMLKKIAKVTHLSNDRRQWCAIGVLGSSIFVIVLFLII